MEAFIVFLCVALYFMSFWCVCDEFGFPYSDVYDSIDDAIAALKALVADPYYARLIKEWDFQFEIVKWRG